MKKLFSTCVVAAFASSAFAQAPLTMPQPSQKAVVMQRIGLTDITVTYHSPLAKDRKVWGGLVPYNEVWRAGANNTTTVAFTHDVSINGKRLPAGTYGLHMIPTEKDWTVIFSNNSASWGSYFYDEKEDALRVSVTPVTATNQDWLSYEFEERKDKSAVLALQWEKLKVPVKVEVEVDKIVLDNIRQELRNVQGFNWQAFNQAANYAMAHGGDLAEANKWADQSIKMNETFTNLLTKSTLLAKAGKQAEADATRQKAMAKADEPQLNAYGYQLMARGKQTEALEVFKMNAKRYPTSWNVYDSLAEGYEKAGDKKQAITNYKQALSKAPENQQARIRKTIETLQTVASR